MLFFKICCAYIVIVFFYHLDKFDKTNLILNRNYLFNQILISFWFKF